MPFFSRVFFAIACFFRVIFDGRFAAAVEQTKALPAAPAKSHSKPSGTNSDRDERHAIPPDEVAAGSERGVTDSFMPPSSSRARDTIDDLVRKTPTDSDSDDDDDDDSIPPVSTESHNTGLRRRSPPKPNTVPPPPDAEATTDAISPPTEPSPGTTLPPPSPDNHEVAASSAQISVDTDSIANQSSELDTANESATRLETERRETERRDAALNDAMLNDTTIKSTVAKASENEVASSKVVKAPEAATSAAVEAPGYAARERGALLLLALLQREGRFVDFLQQDVTDFDDEQIGAAARVVHEGCRKALKGHLKVAPIRAEAEGDKVTLAEGYDVQANKLVGNVSGKPPYKGAVQHRGWRAEQLQLPSEVGDHDPSVLAQAEVEL